MHEYSIAEQHFTISAYCCYCYMFEINATIVMSLETILLSKLPITWVDELLLLME